MSVPSTMLERVRPDRAGFWLAAKTGLLAAVSLAVGFGTPPRSGPFCVTDCVAYPYTDVGAFVPRDYLWMYPASILAVVAVLFAVALHQHTAFAQRLWSQSGLILVALGSGLLLADYSIQLMSVQAALHMGEIDGLTMFSQYNAHGVFIALENLGYLLWAVGFASTAVAFAGTTRLDLFLRWLFRGSGIASVLALLGFWTAYGFELEYRYEIAAISISWLSLIVGGFTTAAWFRRPQFTDEVADLRVTRSYDTASR